MHAHFALFNDPLIFPTATREKLSVPDAERIARGVRELMRIS
jgi:hypothetical protein